MMQPPSIKWAYEFVKRCTELKKLNPTLLEASRIRAILKSNVEPLLIMLRGMISSGIFDENLIFQLDETSCLVKSAHKVKKVVESSRIFIPLKKEPPILHLTILFIVTAAGNYLHPQLLFPEDIDLSSVEKWKFPNIDIKHTKKGWMEKKCFEDIMNEVLMKEVNRIRKETGEVKKKALIILDGHSSRNNFKLWEDLRNKGVEAVILPAHTSHILQPLDLGTNGEFKRALEKTMPFPKKGEMKTKLTMFIRCLYSCMHKAMSPELIRDGFFKAGITSSNIGHVLERCLSTLPPSVKETLPSTRFSVSGRCIITPKFLSEWEQHERKKMEREEKRKTREKSLSTKLESEKERDSDSSTCGMDDGIGQVLTVNLEESSEEGSDEGEEEKENEKKEGEGKIIEIAKQENAEKRADETYEKDKEGKETTEEKGEKGSEGKTDIEAAVIFSGCATDESQIAPIALGKDSNIELRRRSKLMKKVGNNFSRKSNLPSLRKEKEPSSRMKFASSCGGKTRICGSGEESELSTLSILKRNYSKKNLEARIVRGRERIADSCFRKQNPRFFDGYFTYFDGSDEEKKEIKGRKRLQREEEGEF
jgi:hypothetical protein